MKEMAQLMALVLALAVVAYILFVLFYIILSVIFNTGLFVGLGQLFSATLIVLPIATVFWFIIFLVSDR